MYFKKTAVEDPFSKVYPLASNKAMVSSLLSIKASMIPSRQSPPKKICFPTASWDGKTPSDDYEGGFDHGSQLTRYFRKIE